MDKANSRTAQRRRKGHWVLTPLAARPRLAIALVVGLLVGPAVYYLGHLHSATSAIIGWDVTCMVYAAAVMGAMANKEPHHIAATAVSQDVGRGFILGLVICAAVASIAAVAAELNLAKHTVGLEKFIHIGLAYITVAASWFMVQIVFARHYAHEFYAPDGEAGDGIRGGLKFPGGGEPDYWDFLHFSLVIGVASQTADVAFCSKGLRLLGSLHCVLSFTFNSFILAQTINLVAGLF